MSDAYIIIKQNEYMRKFRRAEATDPMRAKSLADLGIKQNRIFRNMQDKAVFLPGRAPETHYMDINAAEDFISSRRKRTFLLLLLGLAVVIVLFLLTSR